MNNWYIIYNGRQVGPMEKSQLLHYGLNPNSQVWTEGMSEWVPAYTIPELMSLLPVDASASPGMNKGYVSAEGKSKVAAGLFAIFLGCLGIQYFYLGKVGGGFLCILLSIITCGIWEIVTFIQGILMITMSDEDFAMKYVSNDKTFPLF